MKISHVFTREFTKEIINNFKINQTQLNPSLQNIEKIKIEDNEDKIDSYQTKILSNKIIQQINNPDKIPSNNTFNNQNESYEDQYFEKEVQINYDENQIYLAGLSSLLLDPNIIAIQCHGPKKFLSIKYHNRVANSNIILSSQEIDAIIQSFSNKAKIPIIGGIFKAIVDNLLITAIQSPYGNRFIITKNPIMY